MTPRTRYAKYGDLNIAYQITGEGALDIVLIPSFVSNIEFWWTSPVVKSWFDRLASFARLILFDKAGTGLSDPIPGPRTLEQRAEEIEAVYQRRLRARSLPPGLCSSPAPRGRRA